MPIAARRILVVLPNWVGDVVLATPALRALRAGAGEARIDYLLRPYLRDVLDGSRLNDGEYHWSTAKGLSRLSEDATLARKLSTEKYDTAILFTNSWRSALLTRAARIPRRVGYAREARGWLLTDKLYHMRENGRFVPSPITPDYARLVEQLGISVNDRKLRLDVTDAHEGAAAQLRAHYDMAPKRYAVINPGGAFGAAKLWLPDRFAAVCDGLHADHGLKSVIVGAPREADLLRDISSRAASRPVPLIDPPTTLGSLKAIIRDAAIMICNDTGPRHYANAFDTPTVAVFGPTHQEWTDTGYAGEIKLQIPVDCGPCQKKTCPLDHRCMTGLTADMALQAADTLLSGAAARRLPVRSA
ncbi:MAG: lipopolysaccharide heptosyltransferase II [Phycisphaerales bacterium]|nr:lipopolysaccharide heptosyltransferase II [Phycisphaerales bacterium]